MLLEKLTRTAIAFHCVRDSPTNGDILRGDFRSRRRVADELLQKGVESDAQHHHQSRKTCHRPASAEEETYSSDSASAGIIKGLNIRESPVRLEPLPLELADAVGEADACARFPDERQNGYDSVESDSKHPVLQSGTVELSQQDDKRNHG